MTSAHPQLVSVVCPFFNESAIIEHAAEKMISALERKIENWELMLVNDGSQDDSLDKLLGYLHRRPRNSAHKDRIKVISYPVNQGRGRALKTGIQASSGDIIVTAEADCSWGEDIVPRLVDEMNAHPESHVIIASPHLPGGGLVNVPFKRRLLTAVGNRLIRVFFDPSITMNTGMTRAYRRDIIVPLEVWENGKEFHLEVLLKLVTLGCVVREIPATITWPDKRAEDASKPKRRSSTRILKTMGTHLRFVGIARPTTYFATLAIVSFIIAVMFMTAALINVVVGDPSVFYALIGILMFIVTLFFICFSVLFVKLGETLREHWSKPYRKAGITIPLGATKGEIHYPSN